MKRREETRRTLCKRGAWAIAAAIAVLAGGGCTSHKQVQYFAVRDENTGVTNYYRLTIKGHSGIGSNYHFQAGYFSAASVDILRGSMPDVPELTLPIEREAVYDRMLAQIDAAILQEAKRIAPVTDPEAVMVAAQSLKARRVAEREEIDTQIKRLKGEIERLTESVGVMCAKRDALKEGTEAARSQLDGARTRFEKAKLAEEEAAGALRKAPQDDAAQAKQKRALEEKNVAETAFNALQATVKNYDKSVTDAHSEQRKLDEVNKAHTVSCSRLEEFKAAITKLEDRIKGLAEAAGAAAYGVDDDLKGTSDAQANPNFDEKFKRLARLLWFNSLSGADIASIGMNATDDPFKFRKLVFWSSASPMDLRSLSTQIDAVTQNTVDVARSYKRIAAQRASESAKDAKEEQTRFAKALSVINNSKTLSEEDKQLLEAMIELLNPKGNRTTSNQNQEFQP